jgi:hypothetical protein
LTIRKIAVRAAVCAGIAGSSIGNTFAFMAGDVYTSTYFTTTIRHYSADGRYVDSLTLPSMYGREIRGMTSGPDGLLYAVVPDSTAYKVLAFDETGAVQFVYQGSTYILGYVFDGKINFGADGHFYVAGKDQITAFALGDPTGHVIYSQYHADFHDVVPLPSGNLLVLTDTELDEIAPSGTFVGMRRYGLNNARAIAYDPDSNRIFMTTGDFPYEIFAFDYSTGAQLASGYAYHGTDIELTWDKRLIVGAYDRSPYVLDENLQSPLGAWFEGPRQPFVVQVQEIEVSVDSCAPPTSDGPQPVCGGITPGPIFVPDSP